MTHRPFSNSSSAVATALLLFLTACSASPTPYQVADDRGGYTNRKLENGSYQATFTGNSATPEASIREAVLFRAAQVTLRADSDYFKVLSNTVEPASKPIEGGLVSTLAFVLVEDEPTNKDPNVYNARELIGELRDNVLSANSAATAVRDGAIVNDLRAPRTRDY